MSSTVISTVSSESSRALLKTLRESEVKACCDSASYPKAKSRYSVSGVSMSKVRVASPFSSNVPSMPSLTSSSTSFLRHSSSPSSRYAAAGRSSAAYSMSPSCGANDASTEVDSIVPSVMAIWGVSLLSVRKDLRTRFEVTVPSLRMPYP